MTASPLQRGMRWCPITRARSSARKERTLWRMLYETAARSAEVLALNVEDLDLPNRQAKVRRKGGESRPRRSPATRPSATRRGAPL